MHIIGGAKKRHSFKAPDIEFRPTQGIVREALFNIIDARELRVLDLYAGSGAIGLEALSRGAERVTFVDIHADAARVIAENLTHLGFENAAVIRKDALAFLASANDAYDLIIADPPYRATPYMKLIEAVCAARILSENGTFVVELERNERTRMQIPPSRIIDERRYGKTALLFIDAHGEALDA